MKARKKLTKAEKKVLERLQTEFNDPKAKRRATNAHQKDFSTHRGAFCVSFDECVVFGNDGFSSDDVRSQVQVAKLVQELERLGIKIKGFGLSKDGGYSWALRVAFHDDWLLDRLVWHFWFIACGMKRTPVSAIVKERLKAMEAHALP